MSEVDRTSMEFTSFEDYFSLNAASYVFDVNIKT